MEPGGRSELRKWIWERRKARWLDFTEQRTREERATQRKSSGDVHWAPFE